MGREEGSPGRPRGRHPGRGLQPSAGGLGLRRLSDCQKFFFERRLEEDEEEGEGVRVRTLAEKIEEEEE